MMTKKPFLYTIPLLLLLGLTAPALADCRTDYIACNNSCILPGIAGALTSKNANSLQSCTNACDRTQTMCKAEESRLRQIEEANAARQKQQQTQQAATLNNERETQARMATVAKEQRLSAARTRHRTDMVFETSQILGNNDSQITPITKITGLKIGSSLIGDQYVYIDDKSNQAIALDLVSGQQRPLNVPDAGGVSFTSDNNKNEYVVIESKPVSSNQLGFQLFNSRVEPVSGLIRTNIAWYLGRQPTDGNRSFFYTVHNNIVYVYTWLHASVGSGSNRENDTQPLELRAYDIQTGNMVASHSLPSTQTLSMTTINQRPVLLAAKPEDDQIVALDAQTGAELYRQPLGVGRFNKKDHVWLSALPDNNLVMVHYRSNNQKAERVNWLDLANGNPVCRFDTGSAYHPVLHKFSAGNGIYNRQCQLETTVAAAAGGGLSPLENGWSSFVMTRTNYSRQLLDAQGNVRVAEPFNSYAITDQKTVLLFTDKQPVRSVSKDGHVATLNWIPDNYAQLKGAYLESSEFTNGYAINIARFNENNAGATFAKQMVKDEFESTAQYRQRISKLSLPFSRPVKLGPYDADTQRLQVVINDQTTAFVVPAEQARRLRSAANVTFNGTVRVLEPEFVEITSPALTGDGVTVNITSGTQPAAKKTK